GHREARGLPVYRIGATAFRAIRAHHHGVAQPDHHVEHQVVPAFHAVLGTGCIAIAEDPAHGAAEHLRVVRHRLEAVAIESQVDDRFHVGRSCASGGWEKSSLTYRSRWSMVSRALARSPVAFARMNAPCRTACVWAARLAAVQSGFQSDFICRAFIAAAMSGSSVAAWPKMLCLQASRIAG